MALAPNSIEESYQSLQTKLTKKTTTTTTTMSTETKPLRTIHLDELKAHTKRDSVWLLIENKIYDVTKFLDDHPGGEEILIEQAGKDSTEVFNDVSHSADAKELMKTYLIGKLPENEIVNSIKETRPADKTLPDSSFRSDTSLTWAQWLITIAISAGIGLLVKSYLSH